MTHEELALILGAIDAFGTVGLAVVFLALFVRGDILPATVVHALCQDAIEKILEEIREWGGRSQSASRLDNSEAE